MENKAFQKSQLKQSQGTLANILKKSRKFNNLMQQIIIFKFVVYENKTQSLKPF